MRKPTFYSVSVPSSELMQSQQFTDQNGLSSNSFDNVMEVIQISEDPYYDIYACEANVIPLNE